MQSRRWVGNKGGRSNELNGRKNLLTGKKTSEMEQVPGEVGSNGLGGPTSRGMRAFSGMRGRSFLPEGGAWGGHLRGRLAPRPHCNTSRGLCLLPTAAQGGAFRHQQKRECFPGLLCLIHLVHSVSAEDLLELRVRQ